jgi:hypothetical protein
MTPEAEIDQLNGEIRAIDDAMTGKELRLGALQKERGEKVARLKALGATYTDPIEAALARKAAAAAPAAP